MSETSSVPVYHYCKIKEITQPANRLNVFGVIHDISKQFIRLQSGKKHTIFDIVDEESSMPFRISIFSPQSEVDIELTKGSIIRIHRLKVESFNDKLDGRLFTTLHIVLFPKEGDPRTTWKSNAKGPTLTESDFKRVEELRAWMLSLEDILAVDMLFDDFSVESSSSDKPTEKKLVTQVEPTNKPPCTSGDRPQEILKQLIGLSSDDFTDKDEPSFPSSFVLTDTDFLRKYGHQMSQLSPFQI